MELQQARPTCGSPELIGIDNDLHDARNAVAQPRDGRFDEVVPICRCNCLYRALEDQDRDAQMLRSRRRGMLKGPPDVDRIPQDEICLLSGDADVEHAGIFRP